MLRISKLADYAIVIMNTLTTHAGKRLSASELAELTRISEPTVGKLLKVLANKKLLQSQLGAKGGYSLATAPQHINLVQVISAIEGEIALTECDKSQSHCAVQHICTVSENWQKISQAIRTALSKISLADMQYPLDQTVIEFNLQAKLKEKT